MTVYFRINGKIYTDYRGARAEQLMNGGDIEEVQVEVNP